MLEPCVYRANEDFAKEQQVIFPWRAAAHSVEHFKNIKFPVRINSIQEVRPLLNSMQENRFDSYMEELGGITDGEHRLLLKVGVELVKFQLFFFPHRVPILPLSVLMSVVCLYKKLLGINPQFTHLLEIGPGCGYLSFFMKCRHSGWLENYSQVEACESFYILQNLINLRCFPRFFEHAFKPEGIPAGHFWTPKGQLEVPPEIAIPDRLPRCEHFPWWHIDKLFERKFQIVTANACFTEMSEAALEDYLKLIAQVLTPDGVLLAQCMGNHVFRSADQVFRKADDFGLTLIAQPKFNDIHNALWVRQGSTHDKYLVDRVFYDRPKERRTYTMKRLVAEVTELL